MWGHGVPVVTGVGSNRTAAALVLVGVALTLAACSSSPAPDARTATAPAATAGSAAASGVTRSELLAYVASVEQIRLPVNRLLDGADPILDAYHDHRISPTEASTQFGALEERFARYTVAINSLHPADAVLRRLNAGYAHTYLFEDSYLSALAAALPDGDFDDLPDTQNAQRLAIIEWRTRLEEIAAALGVHLPSDIQQAGRGEIAPSPSGS